MDQEIKDLVDKWKEFSSDIISPDSGWTGYDLLVEDFQELHKIIIFADEALKGVE
ncbi:hypothetical protein [Oceanobacillus kimchii]|uniref:hypothetical protein n=1 Tax=Oceanobacillus kimchii TaxID=746691 RepID=UPI003C7615D0